MPLIHFINREIYRAVNKTPTASIVKHYLRNLLLFDDQPLFVPLSAILENPILEDHLTDNPIGPGIATRQIVPVSEFASVSEYREHGRKLYRHDKERYPLIFGTFERDLDVPVLIKRQDTTEFLHGATLRLLNSVEETYDVLRHRRDSKFITDRADDIGLKLAQRDDRALTLSLFSEATGNTQVNDQWFPIARLLSTLYLLHYQNITSSDIPTGLTELRYFDQTAFSFPSVDLVFFDWLSALIGWDSTVLREDEGDRAICSERGSLKHKELLIVIQAIREAICQLQVLHQPEPRTFRSLDRQETFYHLLRQVGSDFLGSRSAKGKSTPTRFAFSDFAASLLPFYEHVMKKIVRGQGGTAMTSTRTLILTATPTEAKRLAALLTSRLSVTLQPDFANGDYGFFRAGVVHGTEIVIAQTEMSSEGPSGSTLATEYFIRQIQPNFVVMTGICLGLQPEKGQKLTDVVVSRQLQVYFPRKLTSTTEIPRGSKPDVFPKVLNRVRMAETNWTGVPLHVGLVLSLPYLINDPQFVSKIKAEMPEAVAAEMEGSGLYAASFREKVDWIMIKGISDWGINKDDAAQAAAADNAITFFIHMLEMGCFRT